MKIDKEQLEISGLFALLILSLAAFLILPHMLSEQTELYKTSLKEIHAKEFEYRGHRYIWFYTEAVAGLDEILHDLECPCKGQDIK